MVGVGSPIHKSASLARLHSVSPSQATARKLVRKYSLGSRYGVIQRKELTALRTSLPNVRAASDFDVVMAAIKYIESLQNQVMNLNRQTGEQEQEQGEQEENEEELDNIIKDKVENNNN